MPPVLEASGRLVATETGPGAVGRAAMDVFMAMLVLAVMLELAMDDDIIEDLPDADGDTEGVMELPLVLPPTAAVVAVPVAF